MSKIEENGSLSFLDITITCENNKFVTSVYRKPTFSGVFTNFESFIPGMHERELIETLLHRSFMLQLRELSSGNYLSKKDLSFMVPKKELSFVLPYLGKLSFDLRTRLKRTIERNLLYCKLKIIFRSKCRLNTLFRFKDPLEKKIHSGIIYRYTCGNCKVTYYGKTFRHFYTRAAEHMEISNLTEKCLKNVKQSAILDHLLQCNFAINFDDFSILAKDCNKGKFVNKT